MTPKTAYYVALAEEAAKQITGQPGAVDSLPYHCCPAL